MPESLTDRDAESGESRSDEIYSFINVVRGGLWLYVRSVGVSLIGYLYWVVVSRVGGADVVGSASAVFNLAILVSGTLSFGVIGALRRFLGEAISRDDEELVSEYFWTAILFLLLIRSLASSLLILLVGGGVASLRFSSIQVKFASILLLTSSVSILDSLLISYLRTKELAISYFLGGLGKLTIGAWLVAAGMGWEGALIGQISAHLITFVGLAYGARGLVRKLVSPSLRSLTQLLRAGLPVWLPSAISMVGQNLGVLVVYSFSGSSEAGTYYAAYAVVAALASLPTILVNLLVPVFSGRREDEVFSREILRIASYVSTLASVSLIIYPEVPLGFLGREYLESVGVLRVLAATIVPLSVTSVLLSLIYSRDMYSQVAFLGLSQTLPRIGLYLHLTPRLGGMGAALAYMSGGLSGLMFSILLQRLAGLSVADRRLAAFVGIPSTVGAAIWLLRIPWFVGVPLLVLTSSKLLARLGLLSRDKLVGVFKALTPGVIIRNFYGLFKLIDRMLYGGE